MGIWNRPFTMVKPKKLTPSGVKDSLERRATFGDEGTVVHHGQRGNLHRRDPKHELHLQAADARVPVIQLPVPVCKAPVESQDFLIDCCFAAFAGVRQVISMAEALCGSCHRMTAGAQLSYKWADEKNPKPRELNALDYMRALQAWGHSVFDERTIASMPPGGDRKTLQTLLRRCFRVYAHLYIEHYEQLSYRRNIPLINAYFKEFLRIVAVVDLVPESQMKPLALLITRFEEQQEERRDELAMLYN